MILLAFRNLFRNLRRSSLIMLAIAVSAALVLTTRFFSYGMHLETLNQAVLLNTGYIQIVANGYAENPALERAMDITPDMLKEMKVAGVISLAKRIQGAGLISFRDASKFISIYGVQPAEEKKITTLHQKIILGSYLDTLIAEKDQLGRTVYPCIIGFKLAENLRAGLGQTVSLVTSQFDGSVGAVLVKIKGIFRADENQLDYNAVFLELEAGHSLFGTLDPGNHIERLTAVIVNIAGEHDAPEVYQKLRTKYPLPALDSGERREFSLNYAPTAYLWSDLIPGVIQLINFDQVSNEISIFFIVLILSFGIMNIVQIALHERRREFCVLMALGTSPGQIYRTYLLEIIFLLIPGLVVGYIIAYGVNYYFENYPITLQGENREFFVTNGFAPVVKSVFSWRELVLGVIWIVMPAMFLTVLAAKRIFKLNPIKEMNGR